MLVGPLEPEEKRTSEDAPPAEVNDAAKIGVVVLNGGDGDGVEHGDLFRADVHALGGWATNVADSGAQDVDVGRVFGTGYLRASLRNALRISSAEADFFTPRTS